ncbi:hypothetical protein RI367_001760 [Sorochytrium milnesiophthora]
MAAPPHDDMDIDEFDDDDIINVGEAQQRAKAGQQAMLDELERRKRFREIAVPTDDGRVRQKLREFGHPITLFGEGPAERRDRLRDLLARMEGVQAMNEDESNDESEDDEQGDFWTHGTDDLLMARRWIGNWSLRRARDRIYRQRLEFDTPTNVLKSIRKEMYTDLKAYNNFASQLADDRPASYVVFAPDSQYLATGSFSGTIKLWRVPSAEHVGTLQGHQDRVGGISWHPSGVDTSDDTVHLASGASDNQVMLWNIHRLVLDAPLMRLAGHTGRVCRTEFHPSGRFIGSTSFDATWRLWDAETGQELLTQEGHASEVYSIAFQCDGGLAVTGGLDGHAKLWDLRTGRAIFNLQGHMRQVLSTDFAPNGYQVCTGSEDNSIKIWDLRAMKSIYTIAAHASLVSQVKYYTASLLPDYSNVAGKFERGNGNTSGMYLVSGGFDGHVKIWSEGDYKLLKTLEGHEGKVMSVDISPDSKWIASAGYDRTFKLWASDNMTDY